MNTTEILDEIKNTVLILEAEHNGKFKNSRNKAKSAANKIKNLATSFKKTSDAEFKES